MLNTARDRPQILHRGPTLPFLKFRRAFVAATGRELGLAHLTRFFAKVTPSWQQLPLQGPGNEPLFLDLRQKEGYFSRGFANTIGHLDGVLSHISEGDTVIDIGANIGVWSRYLLSKLTLERIIAFEPPGRTHDVLVKNLASFHNASAVPLAVGDQCGEVHFSTHRDAGQNFMVPEGQAAPATRVVPVTTLDAWASQDGLSRLDLLKVDVEGFEDAVFRGAKETIKRFRPVVYFEWIPATPDAAFPESFGILEKLNYSIQAISPAGELVDLESRTFSNDFIATPNRKLT